MLPGKRKRKLKDCKNDKTIKTDESQKKKKKKKKSLKSKEAMEIRKPKRKDKKQSKRELSLEQDDSLMFMKASVMVKPEPLNQCWADGIKPDHLTQKCKHKRKKKVAFDLSPGTIRIKRPKIASSCRQHLSKSVVVVDKSCSQGKVTHPTQDIESQCTSEDINSQDLFITQKTFRLLSPEPSSGEASVVAATPQGAASVTRINQLLTQHSYSCPPGQHVRHLLRKTKTPQTVHLPEEWKDKNVKISFQKQMKINEENKALSTVHLKPSMSRFQALDTQKTSCTLSRQTVTSTSTQTENLFTNELSLYLNFCQRRRVSAHSEDLRPLDLSLPQRVRKDLGTCSLVKMPSLLGHIKDARHSELHPPPSSAISDVEVKKDGCKREMTLSSQSESEPKSADTTASSEDNETPFRTGKLDLTQVRQQDSLPTLHYIYTGPIQKICCLSAIYSHRFLIFVLEFNRIVLLNVVDRREKKTFNGF